MCFRPWCHEIYIPGGFFGQWHPENQPYLGVPIFIIILPEIPIRVLNLFEMPIIINNISYIVAMVIIVI